MLKKNFFLPFFILCFFIESIFSVSNELEEKITIKVKENKKEKKNKRKSASFSINKSANKRKSDKEQQKLNYFRRKSNFENSHVVEEKCKNDSSYIFNKTKNSKSDFEDGEFNKYILSLDGGGIRGALQLKVLQGIEDELGEKIVKIFDLVGGTSIGGIHALGITSGMDLNEIEKMYMKNSNDFFKSNGLFNKTFKKSSFIGKNFNGLFSPMYDNSYMINYLSKKIGVNRTIGQSIKPTFVSIFDTEQFKSSILESWDEDDKNILVSDAGAATSSAPTYFGAQKIHLNQDGKITGSVGNYISAVDGGVGVNNPITLSIAESVKLWGHEDSLNPFILSIGTGKSIKPIFYKKAKNMGLLDWSKYFPDLFMEAQSTQAEYNAQILLGNYRYARFQKNLSGKDVIMDNTSQNNVKKLFIHGQSIVKSSYFSEVMNKKFSKFYKDEKKKKLYTKNKKRRSIHFDDKKNINNEIFYNVEKTPNGNSNDIIRKALEKKGN